MIAGIGLFALLAVVFTLLTALSRAHELYCVSVKNGRSLVVRGGLPASTQDEVDRVFTGSESDAVVRAFDREDEILVSVTGATESEVRRLKDLLGGLGPEDLPPRLPRDRTWVNFLGFVWLTRWLDSREKDDPPEDPPHDNPPPRSNITPFRP